MNILLTNDDGIAAPGLLALYRELRKIASVAVVAPDSQRSSVGHGITLDRLVTARRITTDKGVSGLGMSGTPADCVKFAVEKFLPKRPDVVISGINLGANDGCSVFYSGTVAAAREASLYGIPAVAISLDTFVDPDFRSAAKFMKKLVASSWIHALPRGTFLSINVPHLPQDKIKGVQFTRQGKAPIISRFVKARGHGKFSFYAMSGGVPRREKNSQIDTVALGQGYITITPLQNDLTDHRVLSQIPKWRL